MAELFPPIGTRDPMNTSLRSIGALHNQQLYDKNQNYSTMQWRQHIFEIVQFFIEFTYLFLLIK